MWEIFKMNYSASLSGQQVLSYSTSASCTFTCSWSVYILHKSDKSSGIRWTRLKKPVICYPHFGLQSLPNVGPADQQCTNDWIIQIPWKMLLTTANGATVWGDCLAHRGVVQENPSTIDHHAATSLGEIANSSLCSSTKQITQISSQNVQALIIIQRLWGDD